MEVLEALTHPGSRTVRRSRFSSLNGSAIASFEAQFTAQTGIGIHDDAQAHGQRSLHSLK